MQAKGRVRRHTLGDDPPGDAGQALRLHRGWHHHHARARTVTGLVGSLYYNDAELDGQRREDARDPESTAALGVEVTSNVSPMGLGTH
jgi:hypothetical protein